MSMVMPATVEDRDADGRRRGPTKETTFFNSNMYFYGREVCCILAILITSYAALQNAPPKISKSPSPVPFFPRTSLVADFYHGQLSPAFERVSESDVSFVMYYAPWDAESQATRVQFKIVAQYFYKQIYFVAINCWQPHSECRQQFSKVQQFPVLIVYTQHNKGVQYKGIREAAHMIRFLQHVLRPVERITGVGDVVSLMGKHDALVVGCFDFAGNIGGPGYYAFYNTALKFLERDPHREVGFAVVTDTNTALQLGVHETPILRMYMWNETLQFPVDADFVPEVLMKWISSATHQVSVWVSPPGVKSLTLAPYVEHGSVLVLFTPRNPLQDQYGNYHLLREVALEYYNCDHNPWVSSLASHMSRERAAARQRLQDLETECSLHRVEQELPPIQVVGEQWTNGSCRIRRKLCMRCRGPEHLVCCKSDRTVSLQTSMLTGFGDERSAEALQEAAMLETCRQLRRARLIHRPVFPHPAYHRKSPRNFSGLACRTNHTIAIIALDSLQFHQFAEGLGIDVLARRDKTAVAILNVMQESSFVLGAQFSKGAVLDLINNYTDGVLNRSLRSHQQHQDCQPEDVCVPELQSDNFHSVVMQPNMAVVVMFHSPFCTFCHSVSHVYLTVARYFRAVHNLTFARIDGENNDFPWEFTMHHYPTIIYFPSHRKSDSRVFPRHHPVTVPNLVNFVLANLDAEQGSLRGMVGLCAGWGSQQDDEVARACVCRVRRECLATIAVTLRQYRSATLRWQDMSTPRPQRAEARHLLGQYLHRLRHLREVHLILGSVTRLTQDGPEYAALVQSYQRYHEALS